MARIASLSQLNESASYDYLAETYGKVIENVEKSTISSILKTQTFQAIQQAELLKQKDLQIQHLKHMEQQEQQQQDRRTL